MASTYTTSIRLEKVGIGDKTNTWGVPINSNFDLLASSINGVAEISCATGNNYLTFNNGSADQARNAVLHLTGTLAGATAVIAPATPKVYLVHNETTGGVMTVRCSAGTGTTIPSNTAMYMYCDGVTVKPASTPINSSGVPVYTTVAASIGMFNGIVAASASLGSAHVTGAFVVDGTATIPTLNGTTLTLGTSATIPQLNSTTVSAAVGNFTSKVSAVQVLATGATIGTLVVSGTASVSALNVGSLATVTKTVATPVILTYATTVAPDFNLGNNFSITLTGNLVLGNPTNATTGQGGMIVLTQDGSGNRSITWGSQYLFQGGNEPVLTSAANSTDVLSYYVASSGKILCNLGKGFA